MEQEQQTPHKRRVRYKGKYPKKFEEKYKELQPEKYQDTIEHVIKKGNTPAGMHISIMVQEILDTLKIQPGETGFDATLGYGGHTKAMLACLNGQGHIYATDVDPEESAKTKKRLEELGYGEDILTIRLQNFCTIDEIAKEAGGFDFILADLGVSSMQIDNPKRGFSFKVDGPLDLRLNQEAGISAAERLDTITREELAGMLYENSDEPYCEELSAAITGQIRKGRIQVRPPQGTLGSTVAAHGGSGDVGVLPLGAHGEIFLHEQRQFLGDEVEIVQAVLGIGVEAVLTGGHDHGQPRLFGKFLDVGVAQPHGMVVQGSVEQVEHREGLLGSVDILQRGPHAVVIPHAGQENIHVHMVQKGLGKKVAFVQDHSFVSFEN